MSKFFNHFKYFFRKTLFTSIIINIITLTLTLIINIEHNRRILDVVGEVKFTIYFLIALVIRFILSHSLLSTGYATVKMLGGMKNGRSIN